MTRAVKLPTRTCRKCGHVWHPRIERRPSACPSCRNPKWDKGPRLWRRPDLAKKAF